MIDPLEFLYYASRPSAIKGFPGRPSRARLSPEHVRCFAWRIQQGDDRDRIVADLSHEVASLVFAVQDVAAVVGFKKTLQHQLPRVVGSEVVPGAVLDELAVRRNALAKPIFDDLDRLFHLYDDLARLEWNQLEKHVKDPFLSFARDQNVSGWKYYQSVRPFYYRAGFISPPRFLNQIRARASFLGRPLVGGAHPELIRRLKVAEREFRKLTKQTNQSRIGAWDPQQKRIGCFVPRGTTTGGWSNHALGLAVDIDYRSNPFVRGKKADLIDEVIAWMFDTGQVKRKISVQESWVKREFGPQVQDALAKQLYENTKYASDAVQSFLRNYLDDWLKRTESGASPPNTNPGNEAHRLLTKMFQLWGGKGPAKDPHQWRGYIALRKLRADGFLTFSMNVLIAMKRAGLRSGTEFVGGKDIMHFDVRARSIYDVRSPRPRGC